MYKLDWRLSKNADATRRYRKRHPDRLKISRKRWYQKKKKEDPDYFRQILRERRKENPDKFRQYALTARNKLRKEVFAAYGNKCTCCGETTQEFLTIDHVYGGGKKHRQDFNLLGANLYYWLRENNYPQKEFQILCANCNMAKARYGGCPHKNSNTDHQGSLWKEKD